MLIALLLTGKQPMGLVNTHIETHHHLRSSDVALTRLIPADQLCPQLITTPALHPQRPLKPIHDLQAESTCRKVKQCPFQAYLSSGMLGRRTYL